jgi:hypothetical protein
MPAPCGRRDWVGEDCDAVFGLAEYSIGVAISEGSVEVDALILFSSGMDRRGKGECWR